jgi:hypothetical protein
MKSTKYSLTHHLNYNYEANGTIWSTCLVNQKIVPYWRINIKSSKELIWSRRSWILTWFNTCGLILTKKELIKCYLYVLDILRSNLIIWRTFSKNEHMKDMKWWVRQDSSWRRINKNSSTMNNTSENSKRESWHRGTICDEEGQVHVQSEESSLLWRIIYH